MDKAHIKALHKKYANDEASFDIVYTHCQIVAEIAIDAAERNNIDVDQTLLEAACLLHDIGCYTLWMPAEQTFKEDGYQQHALIGAAILAEEGLPDAVVTAVRRHVLMGLSAREIQQQHIKLPYLDMIPEDIIGELLCYADRFHSKHPKFNDPSTFAERLEANLPEQSQKFKQAAQKYGLPDLRTLSEKYGHDIV